MESKEPITAEEYLNDNYPDCPIPRKEVVNFMHEYAVLFSKWHVSEALKSACKNAKIDDPDDNEYYPIINENSIENAYPETNIV